MLPRWTVYPAVAILAVTVSPAIPKRLAPVEAPAAAVASAAVAPAAVPAVKAKHPRLVVLGIDGMDPDLLAEVIERFPERTKNFQWLVNQADGIHSLGTSLPPQSPVAWSDFITGRDPGGHGIYDFIHRDYVTRGALGSTTRPGAGSFFGLIPGSEESNRSGKSFWQVLAEHGVPADVWRMPANFPVEESKGLSFPGMMTPAIDSAYGQATLYTTDPFAASSLDYSKIVDDADFAERGGVIRTFVLGPDADIDGRKAPARAPMKIYVDREAGACAIEIGTQTIVVEPGQWTDFMEVEFTVSDMAPGWLDWLPGVDDPIGGVVRFYLRSMEPEVELYASPVNIDPRNPAMDVSQPSSASADLADAIGTYYTQGMAEDVNALKEHLLTDAEFLEQCKLVYTERRAMFEHALDRYEDKQDGGLLFFYYSTVDLMSHMLWRHFQADHPNHDAQLAEESTASWSGRPGSLWKDIIYDVYLTMDPVLGRIRERMERSPEPWTLVVMSDHGFAPYTRKFSINTWLLENGYLVPKEPVWAKADEAQLEALQAQGLADDEGYVLGEDGQRVQLTDGRELPKSDPAYSARVITAHVDWSKTRAYGMGFNGLYLNLAGRELDDPHTDEDESGIVTADQRRALLEQIKAELEAIVDPETGERVILHADIAEDAYANSERLAEAPDLLVGFNVGYCNSDPASIGYIPHDILADNLGGTFNGSHLMAPEVVSGILLSNARVAPGDHNLRDLTVEVLGFYGIEPIEGMGGHRVLAGPAN
ncbi:alkaline phosphatase family protein [Engelhardtia mirabilis]|uniref:Type I phosphodiesterase / nucleotide pyrophosphatase n=1 Tax=Engelhardtia mirabilis TaxID=2528011 RepID=A0A518BFT9_9BACT|nr:Type I phosphodiesterase / nucleotide pyrophosphatase [Planctomycetes bacterium Pla133]QDV00164.1 Type I phosphodiesterase / nucleotide pyrophosphatase [Planctomycetes bacterium Pla86]